VKIKQIFYEKCFGKDEEGLMLHPAAKRVLEIIHKEGVRVDSFLDIGCGDGVVTEKLKQALKSKEAYGIDLFDEALKLAAKSGIKILKVDIDEEQLPFPDANFELVYCGEIIEHLIDPDHLIDEAYRVLKSRGLFVLTTPNLAGRVNRLLLLFGYQSWGTEVSFRYDV
jgi:ubiquinone/menaquinone biosynthesis C-methylase UbiE